MPGSIRILQIYPESFRANLYSNHPFRIIGLIDVSIMYSYGIEIVTLAFYRSSGTNNKKIKGLWYPIVGIKLHTGRFTEFTEYLNFVLTKTTKGNRVAIGWFSKSIYFSKKHFDRSKIQGFSNSSHYHNLLKIGEACRDMYEKNEYYTMNSLDAKTLNHIITSNKIFQNNNHTQKENFERLIESIYIQDFTN
ncbi:MAG: hypothetical protein ACYCWE_20865 [Eubacteriales bacterium]